MLTWEVECKGKITNPFIGRSYLGRYGENPHFHELGGCGGGTGGEGGSCFTING